MIISTTDPEALIRQIKIDQITDRPNPTLKWFNDLWFSLTITQTSVYNTHACEFIYYINDPNKKIPVFYINYSMNQIYYDYDYYSSYLYTNENRDYASSYSLNELTTLLLSTVLPVNTLTPIECRLEECPDIIKALNKI